MRNFFTRLFVFVLMFTAFGASGVTPPMIVPNDPAANLWPEHASTTLLQPTVLPGDQTLTISFPGTTPGNTVWRLRTGGIISLNADPGGSGVFQQETLQIGVDDDKIVQNGNTIEVTFDHAFVEDAYYFVQVSGDAIQFMDESFYSGLGYRPDLEARLKSATYQGCGYDYPLFCNADWAFQVDDTIPPVMANCSGSWEIQNGDRGVDVMSDTVRVCFSEPVSWVGGVNPLASLNNGDIAFYHATNPDLRLPTEEFGGDVLYQKPSDLILSDDGLALKIVLSDPAIDQDMLKSAARHDSVWPADADIYMRFIGGLLVDRTLDSETNAWAGTSGSPAEAYTVSPERFWFTTRADDSISVDIINIDNNSFSDITGSSATNHDPLWKDEEFKITLGETGLHWIDGNAPLSSSNAANLIELELDGAPYAFNVKNVKEIGGSTYIVIEPIAEFLPAHSGQEVTVRVLGGLVRDADLTVVGEDEETFTLGDFNAPVITTSLNNILCTNFDMRVTSDEEGIVYYALIDEDSLGLYWDTPEIGDIYKGFNEVWNTSTSDYDTVYFNHVADPVGGSFVYGVDPAAATWQADSFHINNSLTAFEHIDDFVAQNHGKTFRVYFFALDPDASGPYNTGSIPLDGQATAVSMLPVTLTDCLAPEHVWHSEGVVTAIDNPLFDPCSATENIKKQGRWSLKVPTGGYTDSLLFVNSDLSWDDQAGLIASGVFKLEVTDDYSVTTPTWYPVEIESIVYDGVNYPNQVIVTPLNSYPSAGGARITLQSGTIMDVVGNPVNIELTCEKQVESYCDPMIEKFTVETKDLMFPSATEFSGLNGVVALKDGKITVEFNKPLFTPKRDESNSPVLEPISETATDVNWIGNYIKVRVGDGAGAEVTDDIVDENLFTYEVTRELDPGAAAVGGITKVVMTPIAGQLEYESETWYYVEVEKLLQDVDRRELSWIDGSDVWDNNTFVDPHEQYTPYAVAPDWCETYPSSSEGNSDHYFMRFRTEDKIAPELMFTFEKVEEGPLGLDTIWPYETPVDEDFVSCINAAGHVSNGTPIGAILTEWSQMGFDDTDYYINEDPNGLRPYFTMRDADGNSLDFDIVVLKVWPPDAPDPVYGDAVWFGFVPFEPLAEGETYSMEFNPRYVAPSPGTALAEGDVFIDDNGNPLVHDTYVEFATCVPVESATCIEVTADLTEGDTLDNVTPDLQLFFDRAVQITAGVNGWRNNEMITIVADGTNETWESHRYAGEDWDYVFNSTNNTVFIPWENFLESGNSGHGETYTPPADTLSENTWYTLSILDNKFEDVYNFSFRNCLKQIRFKTPDYTPPAIDSLSPDIDWVNVGDDVDNNLGDDAQEIKPRVPGKLRMWFNEDVTMVPGKLIKIYHNGTSLRYTFVAGAADNGMNGNIWWGDIPADELYYDGHYHVDVQEGFVEDLAGNPLPHMTGWEDRISVSPGGDGTATWTFATGSDDDLYYVDTEPGLYSDSGPIDTIDPNLPGDAYENLGDGTVRVTEVSVTLSEKSVINDGSIVMSLENADTYVDIALIPVSDFVSVDGITWTAPVDFIADMEQEYEWNIPDDAFAASDNSSDSSPSSQYEYGFWFEDITPPTADIWPTSSDTHVAFNSHGYVRFSESLVAVNGPNSLVISQANLKSWIKVYDNTASAYLDSSEYVCEFIDLARTHVRVTFLDEQAPAIGGSTANLIDEHTYTIEVNAIGDGHGDATPMQSAGYELQDAAGNALAQDYSETFDVEDITEPMFDVAMCAVTPSMVYLKFMPKQNVNPHSPTVRTYPAEAGTVYYIVLPEGATAPTADQLFPGTNQLADVAHLAIDASGGNATWTLPASTVASGYDFVVYAVMQDDEVDEIVPPDYNNAWIADDAIFSVIDFPIGIADIREAPNKNMTVESWSFCACDDDAPNVEEMTWNNDMNVPVDETFEITFDELIAFDGDVNLPTGISTGGTIGDPVFSHEVRLRRWDNNVAIPATIAISGKGLTITPDADLDEETKYYIEIDRAVVMDIPGTNCGEVDGSDCDWEGCDNGPNYFDGWTGRDTWWFQTTDNTPPVLTDVSPVGTCVDHTTNQIVFTFKEKNEMVINALGGSSANIYVYKTDEYAIPFEIIPASLGVIDHSGDIWTITYTTQHAYNSDESYKVEWDYDVFTDNAIPTKWGYEDNTGEPVRYQGDFPGFDAFEFTVEDFVLPTFNWTMVSTLWQDFDDGTTVHHDYVWQIPGANGFWDPNDSDPQIPAPVTVNECGDNLVPHKVAFYVWANEPVDYTNYPGQDWTDAFKLEVETTPGEWEEVSINIPHMGTNSTTLYGGVDVDNKWWIIEPAVSGGLDGLTHYRFSIVGGQLEDDPMHDCDPNEIVAGQELFNFCTWDTEPAQATLADGCDITVTPEDKVIDDNIDECVCEKDYFDLCFDKVVLKTADDGAQPPVTVPGAPWFTYANLMLTEADLMDTDDGHYISFKDESGDPVVVDHVEILTPGQCYRLWLAEPLKERTEYTFEVMPDVLKDQVRVPNGNIFPGRTWDFETKWYTAPIITGTTPVDNAINVLPDEDLVIMFNRDVIAGAGHIVVRDNGNPQGVVINVPGTDPSVSIDGNEVTIQHAVLKDNTTYYAEVMADFVRGDHCDQIPFAGDIEQGIIDDEWNWTTGDVDAPIASLWPNQNPNDYTADCVAPVSNLVLTFDENVEFESDCAELVIYKATSLNADGSPSNTLFGDVVTRINFNLANNPQLVVSGTDPANNLSSNVITVIPVVPFESGETYYVRIEGNGIDCDTESKILKDAVGNTWRYPIDSPLPGIHYNDWWFKIADDSAPMLVSTNPVRLDVLPGSQLGEGVTTDLVMEFDRDVLVGTGAIQIWEFIKDPEGGVAAQQQYQWGDDIDVEAAVASGKITIDGNMVTIHDVYLLDGINWYYVLAAPGTFTNDVPCILKQWEGITNPDKWLFSTSPDVTCPKLTDDAITSGALDPMYLEPATVAFELTFSEGVSVANGTGVASILMAGTSDVVATADITPDMIDGNVVTFDIADFSDTLIDQTQYKLVILPRAIHDLGTNSLTGEQMPDTLIGLVPEGQENWMCDTISINFETGDFTPPEVVWMSPTVTCLENEVTVVAKFSEPVLDGTGFLKLVDADGLLPNVVLDAANDEDAADSTVTFTVVLPDETNWYVLVDEGFVTDEVYMASLDGPWDNVAISDVAVWNFGVDDNTVPSLVSWIATDDKDSDITNLDTTFNIVLTYDDTITVADLAMAQLTVGGNSVAGVTAVSIDGVEVTVSVEGVADQTDYELQLGAGFVMDDACQANASVADTAGIFTVGDRTAPIVEDWDTTGIVGTYIDMPVMVDFFDDSDITVDGPITITNLDNLGDTISQVEWTPELDADMMASTLPALWFGSVDVHIPAGTVSDMNGNINEPFDWRFWITDVTPPCVREVTPMDGDACIVENPDLVIKFCDRMDVAEAGQMIHVYELNSTGDNTDVAHILVTAAMITSDSTVTIPLDATTILDSYNGGLGILKDNQDYIVMADEGALRDEAGNVWAGIDDPTFWNWTTGDNTPPEVVLNPAGSVNDINTIVVLAEFTEEVTGAADAIEVAGAESFDVVMNSDSTVATITIVAADMDTVMVTVPTSITDNADCNVNYLADEVTGMYVVGDNTRPTMVVTEPAEPANTLNTFDVVFTFTDQSGGVTGFADALTVDTANLVGIAGADGDLVYTVTLTGDDETDIMVSLDSMLVKDVSVNMNALGAMGDWMATYTVGDHVAPTVAVSPETAMDTTNMFVVSIEFSEDVVGVAAGTTVTGGMLDSVVAVDGSTYMAYINAEDDSTVVLAVAGTITDDSQNANALANPGDWTYTIGDNTPPLVEYINPETAIDTINEFLVTITFNEEVVLGTAPFMVDGGTMGTVESVYDNQSFQFTIDAEDKATVTLTVSTDITDVAGNAFAGATYTYTIGDHAAPVVVSMAPEGVQDSGTNFPLVLTMDEEVVAGMGSLTVYNEDGSVFKAYDISEAVIDGMTVTVDGEFDKFSKYYVLVDAGFVKDEAGNEFAGITEVTDWMFETKDWATAVDPEFGIDFKVYPNPFNDRIFIDNNDKLTRVVVSNIAGQRVLDVEYPNHEIRTGNLVSGMYLVSMYSDNVVVKTSKIIKK